MPDRRRSARVQLVTPIQVYDISNDRTSHGTILNVGAGGLGIRLPHTLELQTPVALEFQLPPQRVLRHVQAYVIRAHRLPETEDCMIGVAFYRLSRDLEQELAAFVDVHRRVVVGGMQG